jgi:hypothetical protein
MGTTSQSVERTNQRIFKLSHSGLQGEDASNTCCSFWSSGVGSEKVFKIHRNLDRSLPEKAAQHPDNFECGSQINEAGILVGEFLLKDSAGLVGLRLVILQKISEDNVGIETDICDGAWSHRLPCLPRLRLHFLRGCRSENQ